MPRLSILCIALAVASISAPITSGAQTTEDRPLTAQGLSMGKPVEETPEPEETREIGSTYIKEEFNDWAMRCIVVEQGENPCQMYQLLADDSGSPIAEFTVFRLPEGGQAVGAATIVAPLETALQAGLTIKVDEDEPKVYPFSFCNTIGCYARIGLSEADVENYKRGAQAVVRIVPFNAVDVKIDVPLSLNGFTAAFQASSEIQQ